MNDYRSIDINAWTIDGEGHNSITYINAAEPDLILKIDKTRINTHEFVKHEFEMSKAVENLGLNVPKMYDMVRVGNAYATLSQRIKNKKSIARICCDEPNRTDEMAHAMCREAKKLFSTPCNSTMFPSRKQQLLNALHKSIFLRPQDLSLLMDFAQSIPDTENCIHGDFTMGNLIMADNQFYWIDLDRIGYGNPMFDIGSLYQTCHIFSHMKQVQYVYHMTQQQFLRFWDTFAKDYTNREDHAELDHLAAKYACLNMVLRDAFIKTSLPEKLFFSLIIHRLVKKYYI